MKICQLISVKIGMHNGSEEKIVMILPPILYAKYNIYCTRLFVLKDYTFQKRCIVTLRPNYLTDSLQNHR